VALRGESERRGRLILDEATEVASDHCVEVVTEMLYRSAPNSIVSYADEVNADLVVVGSRGRSGVRRILLGSTAEEVVRRAPCPVTIVR
jgi:nucleotide-binding universal stress UspA family protein